MDRLPDPLSGSVSGIEGGHITPEVFNLLMQMQGAGMPDPRDTNLINRGTWTQVEDELLTNAVRKFGSKKWTDIAKLVPNRTSKQCRERWCNRLAPNVKHEPFEPWEDQIIIDKQRELGNRWSIIARQLEGRSANAVKNRWYSGLKTSTVNPDGAGHPGAEYGQPLYQGLATGSGFPRSDYRDQNPLGNDL
jgi:hypothetical protein